MGRTILASLVALPLALAAQALTQGQVRRVDRAGGRVTVAHGEIPHLDLPAMTMTYRVRDPSWLEGLRPDDRIRFVAERVQGTYTITRLEK